jgi:hypothetical protein
MSDEENKPRCVTCDCILEGSEQTQGQCHNCRSPVGKIADLDIAIRSPGDKPSRIDGWIEIRYWLEQRFAKPLEKVGSKLLWRRFRDWARFKKNVSTENDFLAYPLSQIVQWLEHEFEDSSESKPPTLRSPSMAQERKVATPPNKRSTEKGDAREKLISALTLHHQYANNSCLNQEPIGGNQLAKLADVSKGAASGFFKREFGRHKDYCRICSDITRLIAALKLLNSEFTPKTLMGLEPSKENEKEVQD